MRVSHLFSVEIDDQKREFIKAAHSKPNQKPEFCLFGDVACFEQATAWCYTCNKMHSAAMDVDTYFVGPSCKNISYENANAAQYANCYMDHDGCSGVTYRLGVKQGIKVTTPAVGFYENTKGVADAVKDPSGTKHRPRIEVGLYIENLHIHLKNIYIYIYCICITIYTIAYTCM